LPVIASVTWKSSTGVINRKKAQKHKKKNCCRANLLPKAGFLFFTLLRLLKF